MKKLSALVSDFYQSEKPVGTLLTEEKVQALAVAAARMYAAYAPLIAHQKIETDSETNEIETCEVVEFNPLEVIDGETPLSVSEWGIIRPLFVLYVELETAVHLEASRGMGVDPYGRSSSEIKSEIQQYENELSHKAFVHQVVTIY